MATVEGVAVALYALPPAEFTAARAEQAKRARADKDRGLAHAVGRLRKPTVAAWAVNLMVRHHPHEVGGLLTLGSQLLEAQAALAGQELRELDRQRHQVMAAVVRLARGLAADAGQPLSDAVALQVENTLRAAMSDGDAARAVLTGLLTTDLTSTGLEPVDVTGAVAVPEAPPLPDAPSRPTPMRVVPRPEVRSGRAEKRPSSQVVRQRPVRDKAAREKRDQAERDQAERDRAARDEAAREEQRRRRAEAERGVHEAEEAAAEASAKEASAAAVADDLSRHHEEVAARIEETAARVQELTALLRALRAQEPTAARDARKAGTARAAAERDADTARRRAYAARARRDELG